VRLTESLFELDLLQEGLFAADIAPHNYHNRAELYFSFRFRDLHDFPVVIFFKDTSAKMKKCLLSPPEKREGKHKQNGDSGNRLANLENAGRGANPKKTTAASLYPPIKGPRAPPPAALRLKITPLTTKGIAKKPDEEEQIGNNHCAFGKCFLWRSLSAPEGQVAFSTEHSYNNTQSDEQIFLPLQRRPDIKQALFFEGWGLWVSNDDERMFMWTKAPPCLLNCTHVSCFSTRKLDSCWV
jgi:hypothetical protein